MAHILKEVGTERNKHNASTKTKRNIMYAVSIDANGNLCMRYHSNIVVGIKMIVENEWTPEEMIELYFVEE